VRAGPQDDAQALPGEPLRVEDENAGWVLIRTAYDYPGWVRAHALDGVVDEGWLAAHDADPIEEARAYLGAPYEWGGLTERGIDCSGLVHMAYRRLGRLVPRDADQQEAAVRPDDLRRGDLVCYGDHIAF
jgi:cell wall-associated NlpC family hydrolase